MTLVTYCDHYKNAPGIYFNNKYNTLVNKTPISYQRLGTYLKCKECKVLTPTVCDEPSTAFLLKKRILAISYLVLSKFAALLAFPIRSDIDPANHPILAKMARILVLPKIYAVSLFQEIEDYKTKDLESRRQALVATVYNRMLMVEYAYAKTKNLDRFFGLGIDVVEKDKQRVRDLREKAADKVGFRAFTFQKLFEMGLLAQPPKEN